MLLSSGTPVFAGASSFLQLPPRIDARSGIYGSHSPFGKEKGPDDYRALVLHRDAT
jgi:hypothetical protein